jgi:hypothetical protein
MGRLNSWRRASPTHTISEKLRNPSRNSPPPRGKTAIAVLTQQPQTGVPMTIVKLSATLTIAGLLAATPVLAQPSQLPQPQNPGFQNPGGVAGGFASSTSKTAATKQKAQTLTPPTNEDTMQNGKQK